MALPKINETTNYTKIKLPSGKTIGIRHWVVKDEKDLLYALETDPNGESNKLIHIANFLKNCTDDVHKFDTLSETDLKKLACELRRISKGDEVEFTFDCQTDNCNTPIEDVFFLSKSEKVVPFNTAPIKVNDELTFSMKEVSYKRMLEIKEQHNSLLQYVHYYLLNSIEGFTFKNITYTEFTEEEIANFVDQLKSNELELLNDTFIENLSNFTLNVKTKCPKCKKESKVEFGELLSFLVL